MSAAGSSKYVPERLEGDDMFDASSAYPRKATGIPQVRTLKPPPEIWELVHPVAPRKRSAAMALVNRITSNGTTLMLLICAALAIGGVSAFLIVRPDKLEAKTNPKTPVIQQTRPAQTGIASSAPVVSDKAPAAAAPTDIQRAVTTPATEIPGTANPTKNRAAKKPVSVSQEVVAERVGADRSESRPAVEGAAERKSPLVDTAPAKPKGTATSSPQVVAPAKTTESPKAKVIPWP